MIHRRRWPHDDAGGGRYLVHCRDPVFAIAVEGLSYPAVRFAVHPIAAHSLSFARNQAIRAATGDLLLFMDCDAIADPRWAAELVRALRQDGVAVAGSRLLSGEDSDICVRARVRGLRILYNGEALIEHQIAAPRVTHRWIFKRLFYAGANRATLGGSPSASHGLSAWDALFLPVIAIPYVAGYAWARLRRYAPSS